MKSKSVKKNKPTVKRNSVKSQPKMNESKSSLSYRALGLTPDDLLRMYRLMKLTRQFDQGIIRLYRQNKMIGGAYSGWGNEATAVGSAYPLLPHDYLYPMHRDIGAHFTKGQSAKVLMLNHLARAEGPTRGVDGTGHYYDKNLRIVGNISHLAAMIPQAVGTALASVKKKENAVVINYVGDGGMNVGEFHEGLNMAAVWKLPFILIIENNQYAYSTPNTLQFACESPVDRALGYGIPGVKVDGTDILEVYRVCKEAFERARRGEGPTLIESVTMRMRGHAEHDGHEYYPPGILEKWEKKDPIMQFEKFLKSEKLLTDKMIEDIDTSTKQEIDEAIEYADKAPWPEPSQAATWVYAE
ncbi:thiamine pyrophosphate-dependent dehydrogenase E1 component subunit alpha [bacterium]|nr:thiamine pyrophosphate-dependent dehydrogenase E1 component subunit alpha [bacterium]NUN45258.1 thiamine pyrophosphate-dependent dehydrogenase E1 component subunit alpha [bacterium]